MAEQKKNIREVLVTGDPAVDWFEIVGKPQAGLADQNAENWKRYNILKRIPQPGGCLLLKDMVAKATGVDVTGPKPLFGLESITRDQIILSEALLYRNKDSYLLERSLGFLGPNNDQIPECLREKQNVIDFPSTGKAPDLVVIDDAGNGFRMHRHLFPAHVNRESYVLYKMHYPLAQGDCFTQWLRGAEIDPEKVVIVLDANDIRKMKEVDISQSLSWERTATDLVYHLLLNPSLSPIAEYPNLIIVFNVDGAMLYHGVEDWSATLVYDPSRLEEDFAKQENRTVMGKMNMFTSMIAADMLANGVSNLEDGIKDGLRSMRQFIKSGYHFEKDAPALNIPYEDIFSKSRASKWNDEEKKYCVFKQVNVPKPRSLNESDPDYWTILEEKTAYTRERIAEHIITHGADEVLSEVPEISFSKLLKTNDRSEIESYSGIKKLVSEYLCNTNTAKPLNIAVFGSPGSGKSFGVREIAKSMGIRQIKTFNLSQFSSEKDLIGAFHTVRDMCLAEEDATKAPLVFFDEFDSNKNNQNLFWLKYFIAPMQDGEFLDGQSVYHIGKSIFVFAGGTRATFKEFIKDQHQNKDAKHPDFVSRLRGFINIKGPNPYTATEISAAVPAAIAEGVDPENGKYTQVTYATNRDGAYIIRRAKLIRTQIELSAQTRSLFDLDGRTIHIDNGVLRALLKVPEYKHGNRSINSIIEMSRLTGKTIFDKSSLPPKDQLDLHVDAEAFMFLLEKERFTTSRVFEEPLIMNLARRIHQDYIRRRKMNRQQVSVSESFDDLPREKQESNRHAAEDIPRKLRLCNCGLRWLKNTGPINTPLLLDNEIELLAGEEHERWCMEQRLHGWFYGEYDREAKRTPSLVPYQTLPEEIREYDRESVINIPLMLAEEGIELLRMKERDEIAHPVMIEKLSKIIHDQYVKEQVKIGGTEAVNPSMAPWEKLPDHIRESNRDSARQIPAKLLEIGCRIRPIRKGKKAGLLELTPEEIEKLSELEHARWCWEKRLKGFVRGEKTDNNKKIHRDLVPYTKLSEAEKDKDRNNVRLIPGLLAAAGYEIYRVGK